jgi:selenocysteine-specific elongation factor
MSASHLVIGTAGHIDHGKTSLVRALTGVDLDSAPEERARGITISLGFTHLRLPSGRVAAFVDVPGHERLVRTMISGASGLDAVMLCVAAPEGVMPQTREHLDILNLMGITQGFVVLTMCDLVDADTIAFARMEIEDITAGTFLEGHPVLETVAGDAPAGLEQVIATIDAIADQPRAAEGPFRLPIDRAFIQKGFGTVATGTARAGAIQDGAEVRIEPVGIKARIRGMQVHGEAVKQTQAGFRTAINLAGIERDDLSRGMVIVSEMGASPASILDVQLHILPTAPSIESGTRVRLLVDTAEVMAVLDVIGAAYVEPGRTAWAQLRTETPIVAMPQDRFVLRRESPVETLGGGTILDPWAPRARKKRHADITAELEALHGGDTTIFLKRAGPQGLGREARRQRGVTADTLLGDRAIHSDWMDHFRNAVIEQLTEWHKAHPLVPGAPRQALHIGSLSALDDRAFFALLATLETEGAVVLAGPRIRLESFSVQLDPAQRTARDALEQALRQAGLTGLKYAETVTADGDLLHMLLGTQRAERIGAQVVHKALVDAMVSDVRQHLAAQGQLKPADFKALTNLSRKYAIPMLEWLDAKKVTQRRGDSRFAANK